MANFGNNDGNDDCSILMDLDHQHQDTLKDNMHIMDGNNSFDTDVVTNAAMVMTVPPPAPKSPTTQRKRPSGEGRPKVAMKVPRKRLDDCSNCAVLAKKLEDAQFELQQMKDSMKLLGKNRMPFFTSVCASCNII